MKRVFLLIVAPALLAALGFAQTPTATSNSDQTSIKGCLGGTDGNFTIAEDNTGQTFKITTSSVDLKPQVGHDIKLTGHKTSGAGSSGSADNSLAVTEMNMISEHCTAAAAVPAATVSTSPGAISPAPAPGAAPEASVSTPAAPPTPDNSASTPAAVTAAPAATVNTPAAAPIAPDAIVPAPAAPAAAPNATVSAPPAAAVEPGATVIASAAPAAEPKATVSAPAAAATHRKQPTARLRKEPAKAAAAVTPTPDETVKPPVADAAPDATASTPSETASTATPAPAKPAKSSWGMPLGIAIVVLVLLAGATAPLISRWRKRRLLEKTGVQNLSFSHTAASDPGKSDTPVRRKAA